MKQNKQNKSENPSQFTNLHNLEHFFKDEKTCRDFIKQRRWNNIPVCPHCGSFEPYELKDGKTYKCKECVKFFTVLTGTMFENTKIPLIKWFKALYIVTSHKKGISSIQLGKDLGLTQKSAWFVIHRIRQLAEEKTPFMLSGTVQVDETYIGGKESNKHQSLYARSKRHDKALKELGRLTTGYDEKVGVLGLLDENGKIVTKVMFRASRQTILPVIEKHVPKSCVMVTDELSIYKTLPSLGYSHQFVKHGIKEYAKNGYHTNSIEGAFSLLKRGIIGIFHHVSAKHLHRYCSEFSFRYNTRELNEVERFGEAVKQLENTRLKYSELIKKPDESRGEMQA